MVAFGGNDRLRIQADAAREYCDYANWQVATGGVVFGVVGFAKGSAHAGWQMLFVIGAAVCFCFNVLQGAGVLSGMPRIIKRQTEAERGRRAQRRCSVNSNIRSTSFSAPFSVSSCITYVPCGSATSQQAHRDSGSHLLNYPSGLSRVSIFHNPAVHSSGIEQRRPFLLHQEMETRLMHDPQLTAEARVYVAGQLHKVDIFEVTPEHVKAAVEGVSPAPGDAHGLVLRISGVARNGVRVVVSCEANEVPEGVRHADMAAAFVRRTQEMFEDERFGSC